MSVTEIAGSAEALSALLNVMLFRFSPPRSLLAVYVPGMNTSWVSKSAGAARPAKPVLKLSAPVPSALVVSQV